MELDRGVGMVTIVSCWTVMFFFDSIWDDIKYREHKLLKKKWAP